MTPVPKYLLLPATYIHHNSIDVYHSMIYIVNNDVYLNNTRRTHCCVCTPTMVTRARNILTLFVCFLSYWHMTLNMLIFLGSNG